MDAKVVWLFVFVLIYWAYCIFWGVKGALASRTASDYFIAGRGISIWVFVLAATATSFSGWTFMGHPGLIYRDGLPYAYASFYAITIPFTGVLFLKRQWMIGKRFGFVTPGEMLSDYFRSDSIRILVVIVALVFSVPYLGVQLRASGFLFNVLTDGMLSVNFGMWVLSAVVIIYVASGGLRAVAYVDTMQCILLAGGIVAIGAIALAQIGGMGRLIDGIGALSQEDRRIGAEATAALGERGLTFAEAQARAGAAKGAPAESATAAEAAELAPLVAAAKRVTPDGYSHYIAIPGVIQFVDAGGKAQGGAWTGIMILAYMFALMGIQSAPAFTMWAFSNHNPKPFAPQQVWASSFGIGLILFAFTAVQGMGAHLLGADLSFARAYPDKTAESVVPLQRSVVESAYRENITDSLDDSEIDAMVVAALQTWIAGGAIPTFGELASGEGPGADAAAKLVARHAGAEGAFDAASKPALIDLMDSAGKQGMLVPQLIDLVADSAPWLVGLLSVCALAAMQSTGAAYMSTAGGMLTRDLLKHYLMPAASHAQQKLFGRIGVVAIVLAALVVATVSSDALVLLGGLAVAYGFQMWPALIAVCWWPWLTRAGVTLGLVAGLVAVTLTESIGQQLGVTAWGRWPLTVHSAGWGILCNFSVAVLVSFVTQNRADHEHKMVFHSFLRDHARLPEDKRRLIPRAWAFAIVWFLFAIGPGAVVGNTLFGDPNDPATWLFGIPSIWAWQILWWALGVFMMWLLAYKMELSTAPSREIEALRDDIGDAQLAPGKT